MTKLSNDADLRVNVNPEPWEHEDPTSRFSAGIYTVALNSGVEISFVPDVSDSSPPWDVELPADIDDCSSEREARVYRIRTSDYSVTPNQRLANQEDEVPHLPATSPPDLLPGEPEPSQYGVVWYVSPAEWSVIETELRDLAERTHLQPDYIRLSRITLSRLGRFLNERFLPSPRLSPFDLRILRRG
jgi:hypothetical protein